MVEKGADCSARLALGMNLHSARHGLSGAAPLVPRLNDRVLNPTFTSCWSDKFARPEVSHTPVVLRKANSNNASVPHSPTAVRAAVGDGHINVVARMHLHTMGNPSNDMLPFQTPADCLRISIRYHHHQHIADRVRHCSSSVAVPALACNPRRSRELNSQATAPHPCLCSQQLQQLRRTFSSHTSASYQQQSKSRLPRTTAMSSSQPLKFALRS